jgi:hypothetical protein
MASVPQQSTIPDAEDDPAAFEYFIRQLAAEELKVC